MGFDDALCMISFCASMLLNLEIGSFRSIRQTLKCPPANLIVEFLGCLCTSKADFLQVKDDIPVLLLL